MNKEDDRALFEQITFHLNTVARSNGVDDRRTRATLFAHDPDDDDDYAEDDISAIWFGWRLHRSLGETQCRAN